MVMAAVIVVERARTSHRPYGVHQVHQSRQQSSEVGWKLALFRLAKHQAEAAE
jgi:hypothetical protein